MRLGVLVLTPPALLDPSIAIAASRAGATGVLDLEWTCDVDEAVEAVTTLVRLSRASCGVRLGADAPDVARAILRTLPDTVDTIVLTSELEDEDVDWKSMDVAPGQTADMPVAADANGLFIGGALDDGQLVVLEIYNPAGLLVGTSPPAVGRVMVSVPVTLAGNYTLRARNIGLTNVGITLTSIRSAMR